MCVFKLFSIIKLKIAAKHALTFNGIFNYYVIKSLFLKQCSNSVSPSDSDCQCNNNFGIWLGSPADCQQIGHKSIKMYLKTAAILQFMQLKKRLEIYFVLKYHRSLLNS